jgi:hypothetical protein
MRNSEEYNLRGGLVHDPAGKGAFDSSFWHGDTANLVYDTVRGAYRLGDTGLPASASSYSQYLFGDFEFTVAIDSLSPDSNDGASATEGKLFGLKNIGDTLQRGAAYFELRFDSVTAGDTTNTRPFRAVMFDEAGNKQAKNITWDTNWSGGGRLSRFRISWEEDGYTFLVNDTVYATLGDRPSGKTASYSINTTIPQAIRISNRSVDTTDTNSTALKLLVVRNSRMISPRLML